MKRTFRWKMSVPFLIVSAFVLTLLLNGSTDAAAVGERIPDSIKESVYQQSIVRYNGSVHHIVKRHFKLYKDKQYGDGSLKNFFFMLKIILTLFGKH